MEARVSEGSLRQCGAEGQWPGRGAPGSLGTMPNTGGPHRYCFLHPRSKFAAPVCASIAADLWAPSQGASAPAV